MNKTILIITFAVFLMPMSSLAAEYDDFRRDLTEPYGFYKKALSLTSKTENQEKAAAVTKRLLGSWQIIVSQYQTDVPTPFAQNEDFAAQIAKPVEISAQALALIKENKVLEAHAVLEEIRYLLWEMRIDAGIVSLNDKVNDFHEAMEIVSEGISENAGDLNQFGHRYGAWLAIKWNEVAKVKDKGTETAEFAKAIEDGHKAIEGLRKAMAANDQETAKKLAKSVKSAYKAIFFMTECA